MPCLILVIVANLGGVSMSAEPMQERRQQFVFPLRTWLTHPSVPQLPQLPSLPPMPQLPSFPSLSVQKLSEKLRRRRRQKAARGGAAGDNTAAVEAMVCDSTSSDETWELKVERDEVRVWRRSVEGSAYDVIRGNGILRAPPAVVLALLKRGDPETIREYNPMYDEGHDLQQLDGNTKVSYGSVRSIFPFKPRDTVTRVALRALPNLGGHVMLLEAVDHPAMPERQGFVRAKIVFGMHLVQPVVDKPMLTNYTFTQQVNVGGLIPAWLMNTLIAQDAVVFVQWLGKSAQARSKGSR